MNKIRNLFLVTVLSGFLNTPVYAAIDFDEMSAPQVLQLAKQGNPEAQNKIADIYYYGDDETEQDFDQALMWYEKAANQVITMDDQADAQYEKAKEVYVDLLARKEHDTGTLVDVLLVGKYLERICDHCVNIGKWVLYQKSGIFEEIE